MSAGAGPGVVLVAEAPKVWEVATGRFAVGRLPYPGAVQYDPDATLRLAGAGKLPVVVLAHLNIPGLLPGEESLELARGRDVFFPVEAAREVRPALMVCGHHHKRQVTPDGIHVVGSPARLTFGEQGHDPAFLVLEVKTP